MTIDAALMSSARTGTGSDSWCTPPEVLDLVRQVGPIHLDPCWNENALTFPVVKYTEDDNGLVHDWGAPTDMVVFVNPPYSDIRTWMRTCQAEWERSNNDCTIALIPARTDTRAWHEANPGAICFWKGRITFLGAPAPAPFPSAFLCWARGEMLDRFCRAFSASGMVVRL